MNWELRRQFLCKAYPESGGNSDPNPQLKFHRVSGTVESLRASDLKRIVRDTLFKTPDTSEEAAFQRADDLSNITETVSGKAQPEPGFLLPVWWFSYCPTRSP